MLNALGLVIDDDRVLVSSVDVAEKFERKHKNIVRAIESLRCSDEEYHRLNFEPMIYNSKIGKGATREFPGYYMTRDGFTLLVMGFTGEKAIEWKIKYIKAFNEMERIIREQATAKMERQYLRTMRKYAPEYIEQLELNCKMAEKSAKTAMTTASLARKRELVWKRRLDAAVEQIISLQQENVSIDINRALLEISPKKKR